MNRQTWSERLNAHLLEAQGEVFTRGKWRWWFPLVALLTVLNGGLTAFIFRGADTAATMINVIVVSLGGLLCWLAVAGLHYSDNEDSRLARGVSMLDSVTLCFVIAHFCFLFWAFGHLVTLRSTEADYNIKVEQFNAKAEGVSRDNTEIARAAAEIARENTRAEKLRNDTAYQTRKAAEAGVVVGTMRQTGGISPTLSTTQIELQKPTPPEELPAKFLMRWDSLIRLLNFGELILAAITLIYIRNRSAKSNTRNDRAATDRLYDEFVDLVTEVSTARPEDRKVSTDSTTRPGRETILSTARPGRETKVSTDSTGRKAHLSTDSTTRPGREAAIPVEKAVRESALVELRNHLKVISSYHPGLSFKTDLIEGGVKIKLYRWNGRKEKMIASTRQSDKLLLAVYRPDFLDRLIAELKACKFPIGGVK
jgi:hypothetical protein